MAATWTATQTGLPCKNTGSWSCYLPHVDPHGPSRTPRSVSSTWQGLGALLSLCPPKPAPRGPIPKAEPALELQLHPQGMPQHGFPPWMGLFPGEWGSATPALAESEGTSPAQPRPGDRAQRDRAVPLQASKHSSQECSPGRQTAPVFLQEPSSPLQLAFLEIPLLPATKTLFSLFPWNSRGSRDSVFLQAAQLSYKAAHTWSGLSCRPPAQLRRFPSCSETRAAVSPFTRDIASNTAQAAGQGPRLRSLPTELSHTGNPFPTPLKSQPAMFGAVGPRRLRGRRSRDDSRAWGNGEGAAATYRGGESRRHLPNLLGLSI